MRDAVWNNGDAALLLSGPGDTQLSMVWQDAETGLLCKGRIDRRCRAMGLNLIVDLKTTRNAQTWAFTGDIAKYRYHAQLAFYVDGLATLAPAERHVVFLVVEKDPPFCSRLVGLSPEALDAGRAEYRRYMHQYIHARDTGQWPG